MLCFSICEYARIKLNWLKKAAPIIQNIMTKKLNVINVRQPFQMVWMDSFFPSIFKWLFVLNEAKTNSFYWNRWSIRGKKRLWKRSLIWCKCKWAIVRPRTPNLRWTNWKKIFYLNRREIKIWTIFVNFMNFSNLKHFQCETIGKGGRWKRKNEQSVYKVKWIENCNFNWNPRDKQTVCVCLWHIANDQNMYENERDILFADNWIFFDTQHNW